jgi:diketogulonate reductase-like aldo/keto reductase
LLNKVKQGFIASLCFLPEICFTDKRFFLLQEALLHCPSNLFKLMMSNRPIPSTNESLPVIGLGTWQAFNVSGQKDLKRLGEVLAIMHSGGGRLIDSSSMYGLAEENIGRLTPSAVFQKDLFYATKVWTRGREEGISQMNDSFRKMGRSVMDLMQIHNLVDWKTHLAILRKWKTEGRVRYIGITHYTDSMHPELERIIRTENIDFVQFNYSILSREAEKRLLPAAAEHGVATIINQPLNEGTVYSRVRGRPLPAWAKEYEINTWTQFFLKFIIGHPAVTTVIPATGNPEHMMENMRSGSGRMPDSKMRERMAAYLKG